MRKGTRLGGLFLGFALLSFTLTSPNAASSATRNAPSSSCFEQRHDFAPFSADYDCSLMTESATYTVAALTKADYDFVCPGSGEVVFLWLVKSTITGSGYADYTTVTCSGGSSVTGTVTASSVKTNPSTNDYLYARVWNASQLYGIRTTYN